VKVLKLVVTVAFSAAMLVIVPATNGRPVAAAPGLSLLSVNDEVQLGQQAQSELRQQTPVVGDAAVNNYLRGVFSQLVRRAGGPGYPYSVSMANYGEVNAFALPGGPVWVHRGAVQAAQNESQLAGVLAHEIAHISRRHVADRVTKSMVTGGLLALLGQVLPDDRKGQVGGFAAGLAAQGFMLKFSRDDEREADLEGARIMRQAGWDARGMPGFMDLLSQQQRRNPSSVEVFLSDHPGPAERAAALRAQRLPAGGRTDSAAFQQIRARLRSLGPTYRMRSR
jgi:predicted Zn-dependent protease